jgi:hypothetical protein
LAAVLLLILVFVACVLTLRDWRSGLLSCVVIGLLQDPVRKITPGTPPYLLLAFMPVYLIMFLLLFSKRKVLATVRRYYPELITPASLCGIALLCSTAQTLSYGPQAVPMALLGNFSYAGGIPALMMGFFYFRRDYAALDKVLICFAALVAVMLIGVPLEYLGVRFSVPILGLINAREDWLRWYDNGTTAGYVRMISGFHRSPEVMGWQAAVMAIIALFLITRRPRWLPLWLGLAAWGIVCVLLSGRRKMLIMILVFVIAYILMSKGWYRQWLLVVLLIACVLVVPLLGYFVQGDYLNAADSTRNTTGERLRNQLVEGPLYLLNVVGVIGYGVGTRTQGTQHIDLEVEVPPMEGGFEKILVELGLFGTAAFLYLAVALASCAWRCYNNTRLPPNDKVALGGLIAFLAANLAAFTVAFQIFGDPLVLTLVGFAAGFLLSAPRLELEQRAPVPRAPAHSAADPPGPTTSNGAYRPVPRLEAR